MTEASRYYILHIKILQVTEITCSVPIGHASHSASPLASLMYPGLHSSQRTVPVLLAYEPASQMSHAKLALFGAS